MHKTTGYNVEHDAPLLPTIKYKRNFFEEEEKKGKYSDHLPQMPFCNEYGAKHSHRLPVQTSGAMHWQYPDMHCKLFILVSQGNESEQAAPLRPTLNFVLVLKGN